jgi:phosphohistidine phosphatase
VGTLTGNFSTDMKLLTLIRHAKSSHDSPTTMDFHRPLAPRGQADAPRMGKHLDGAMRFSPDKIISSPAARAISTARLIAKEIGYDSLRIEQAEDIYEAPTTMIAMVIKEVDDGIGHLCIVGHNPGLELLSNWLAGERVIDALVTTGVVMMELDISGWSRLRPGCGKLLHYLTPKSLSDDR